MSAATVVMTGVALISGVPCRLDFGEVVLFVRLMTGLQLALHRNVCDGELIGQALANLRQDARLRVQVRLIHHVNGQASRGDSRRPPQRACGTRRAR